MLTLLEVHRILMLIESPNYRFALRNHIDELEEIIEEMAEKMED